MTSELRAEVEALRCDGVRAETAGFYNGWHSALDAVLALYTRKGVRELPVQSYVYCAADPLSAEASIFIERMPQRSGPDLWAARKRGCCLNKAGEWEWEPQPSSRDDAFLARCRFATQAEAADLLDALTAGHHE